MKQTNKVEGWCNGSELDEDCKECGQVLYEGRMCSCEYGNEAFPCARNCKQFESVEGVG